MGAEAGGESNGGAEAEENGQSIEDHVNYGDAEPVDEGGGEEVEQGEQPPYTREEGVVDNSAGMVRCASNVVSEESDDDDGADELPGAKAN